MAFPVWSGDIMEQETRHSTVLALIYIIIGPLVWAAYHSLIYASHWMLCSTGRADSTVLGFGIVPVSLLLLTALAASCLALAIAKPDMLARLFRLGSQPEIHQFSRKTMRLLAVLSLFGVIATGATTLFIPACISFR